MKKIKYAFCLIALFCCLKSFAQQDTSIKKHTEQTTPLIDSSKQRDAIDILKEIFKKNSSDARKKPQRLNFSAVPAIGYSLSTGFAVDLTGNVAFYTSSSHKENLSAIDAELTYDTKGQKIFVSRSEIWADNNNYKLVTDLRLERYPDDTYGLGTSATDAKDDPIDFSYIRTYATLFKKVIPDYYVGFGYNLDRHYNISETGTKDKSETEFDQYGKTSSSTSSGFNIDLLYDSRRNPINPLNGAFASIQYRNNFTFLGSDHNWRELQLDFRKYFKLSPLSNNILAFWSLATFTGGNTPYLDLPATGDDMYNNSGRGYAQNRFRGKDRLYLESEYRFGITHNGLIGGVVFANAESFTGYQTNSFEKIAPAGGTGLRIKINKHSNTNVCIDYAYGIYGSHGFFVNLGEVF
ncbi:BamA/TamA family outer membrane protein [Mucilaginibacter sp.]|uniref:BamA/TamA family outer membrane protein n=1 Tax=Mucilaginibacter sp. TaxID=1882438 RepID=UPI003D133BBF